MAPASGGAIVLKPGMNLATTRDFAPQREIVLGLADAGIGRQRNLAQQAQDAFAVVAAGAEPEVIADEAGQHGHGQVQRPAGPTVDGQRTRDDQHRKRGNGQPDLFEQDDAEHDQDAIHVNQVGELGHPRMVAENRHRRGESGNVRHARNTVNSGSEHIFDQWSVIINLRRTSHSAPA